MRTLLVTFVVVMLTVAVASAQVPLPENVTDLMCTNWLDVVRAGTYGEWFKTGYISGVMSAAFQPEFLARSSVNRRITVREIITLVDSICASQPYAKLIDVTLRAMGMPNR
jgi:hypothetical protein